MNRVLSFGSILLLSFGVAMDATAVAATRGCAVPRVLPHHVALVVLFFGGFQALMPLVGWIVGVGVGSAVHDWDHWIAFALLSAIGAKMLWEARSPAASEPAPKDPFAPKVMFLLAVATSIDALAVGATLPLVDAPLLLSLATIGITTAIFSVLGLLAGRRFGALLGKRPDLVGGVVLIGLGTKTLFEHLGA